jgi:hypothetical protein
MNSKFTLISLVALLSACSQSDYYSVVRTQMPGGYAAIAVQKTDDYASCDAATRRYVAPVRASCKECKVERAGCERSLAPQEQALWDGHPGQDYSVAAGSLRVLLTGPANVTKSVCMEMAKDIGSKGMQATCMPPLGK